MEYIKVPKVDNVHLLTKGVPRQGSLHITPHHLIFRHDDPKASPSEKPSSLPSRSSSSNSKTATRSKALPSPQAEIWITYPIISQATRSSTNSSGYSSLRIRCRDFTFITFHFFVDKDCKDAFESIKALSCKTSLERLYAFFYQPPAQEAKYNGWKLYDAKKEYERMGVGSTTKSWRFSNINSDYTFCPSYPSLLVVPTSISDNTLKYVSKYRSRERIPALTYLHSLNNCSITRSSQPLVGVRGNRSVQDEKLVAAIFSSSDARHMLESYEEDGSDEKLAGDTECSTSSQPEARKIYGAQQNNLIIDARPTVNAYAMQAVGAGSENMDNYRMGGCCTKQYLGIDNIHVMRESLMKVVEAIKDSDVTPLPPNKELLRKSGWLGHVTTLMEGVAIIVKQVAIQHSHVLIHCSDGWDRTSQLSALAQLCLDPYYRTFEGFMVLVEKDWLSFGHRFRDRSGIGSSEKSFTEKIISLPREDSADDTEEFSAASGFQEGVQNAFSQAKLFFGRKPAQPEPEPDFDGAFLPDGPRKSPNPPPPSVVNMKETSPTFHQFLDATYQLLHQNPTRFQFNERFLRRLLYHVYSCQYGTFLYNCERERLEAKISTRTRSVWDYFLSRKHLFTNPHYATAEDVKEKGSWSVIVPKSADVRWWWELWGRSDQEMNGIPEKESVIPPAVVSRTSSENAYTATPPVTASLAKSASPAGQPLTHQHAASSLNTPDKVKASTAENDSVNSALDVVQGGLQGLKLGVEGLMRGASQRNASPARNVKEQIEVEMM